MPRVSKTELQLRQAIDALSKMGHDETKPDYIRRPALQTIVRHAKDIRRHKLEMAKLEADRKAAEPVSYPSVLPSNGREPAGMPPNGWVKPWRPPGWTAAD